MSVPAGRISQEAGIGGNMGELTSVEICAGAGGQAPGLEQAGFAHEAVIELDPDACDTLRRNRGSVWKVVEDDVANVDGRAFGQIDLFAGGGPCPPFSIAGKRRGGGGRACSLPGARAAERGGGAACWAAGECARRGDPPVRRLPGPGSGAT